MTIAAFEPEPLEHKGTEAKAFLLEAMEVDAEEVSNLSVE